MREHVWRDGEAAASRVYRERGYRVLARNWRCELGELDLILARGDEVVFCEVKARRPSPLGEGYEAVTRRKQAKIRALARAYCVAERPRASRYRFDVASVVIRGGRADVNVFEDAF